MENFGVAQIIWRKSNHFFLSPIIPAYSFEDCLGLQLIPAVIVQETGCGLHRSPVNHRVRVIEVSRSHLHPMGQLKISAYREDLNRYWETRQTLDSEVTVLTTACLGLDRTFESANSTEFSRRIIKSLALQHVTVVSCPDESSEHCVEKQLGKKGCGGTTVIFMLLSSDVKVCTRSKYFFSGGNN